MADPTTPPSPDKIPRLTPAEFREEFDTALRTVERMTRDQRLDGFAPMLHVLASGAVGQERLLVVFAVDKESVDRGAPDWDDYDGRRALLAAVGASCVAQKKFPLAVILVSEAWALMAGPGTSAADLLSQRPSLSPDRVKVLTAMGTTPDGLVLATHARIVRDDRDRIEPLTFEEAYSEAEAGLLDAFWSGFRAAGLELVARLTDPRGKPWDPESN